MTVLGIAALALLFAWLFGGFLLRFGGLLLTLAGAIGLAVSANGNGILVAAIGASLWLLGHGLYAVRHGLWKSCLAAALWSSAGSALGRLSSLALHRSDARRDERRLAGAETPEVERQA